MAPEQRRRRAVRPPAGDWYSVGVMLFEALTGTLPFAGSAVRDPSRRSSSATRRRPRDARAGGAARSRPSCAAALLSREPARRLEAAAVLMRACRATGRRVRGRRRRRREGASDRPRRRTSQRCSQAFARSRRRAAPVTVFVHGGSGMGKTRAGARASSRSLRAAGHGAVVLAGRCYERESVPYKALDSLVDALSRLPARPRRRARSRRCCRATSWRSRACSRCCAASRPSRRRSTAALEIPDAAGAAPARVRGAARAAGAAAPTGGRRALHRRPAVGRRRQRGAAGRAAAPAGCAAAAADRHAIAAKRPTAALRCAVCCRTPGAPVDPSVRQVAVARADAGRVDGADRSCCGRAALRRRVTRRCGRCARPAATRSSSAELVRSRASAVATRRPPALTPGRGDLTTASSELPDAARHLLEVLSVFGQPLDQEVANRGRRHRVWALEPSRCCARSTCRARACTDQREELETVPRSDSRDGGGPPVAGRVARRTIARWRTRSCRCGDPDPEVLAVHFLGAGERRASGRLRGCRRRSRRRHARVRSRGPPVSPRPRSRSRHRPRRAPRDPESSSATRWPAPGRGGRGGARRTWPRLRRTRSAHQLELRRRAAEQLLRSGHIDEGFDTIRSVLAAIGMSLAHVAAAGAAVDALAAA